MDEPEERGRPRAAADGSEALADRFERERVRLRTVAFRMLGSASEADDAVQEAWLRLSRTDAGALANLSGWLTTVTSRICLDLLRVRRSRAEDPYGDRMPEELMTASAAGRGATPGAPGAPGLAGLPGLPGTPGTPRSPEDEVVLTDSVGRALLVVLDTLGPAERVAFVLHDMFAVPFDTIAPIVDRSPVAAKKLASRARRRVRGTPVVDGAELARHRHVVDAFLAAARGGDFGALLTVLAPDVVRRADPAALPPGTPSESHGAEAVARETVLLSANARVAAPALVDGRVGIVVAPHGRLRLALTLTFAGELITSYTVHADPARLRAFELAVLA